MSSEAPYSSAGLEYIRANLSSGHPFETIRNVQREFGLRDSFASSVIPFLPPTVSRYDVHMKYLNSLVKVLLKNVENGKIGEEGLNKLLERFLPFVRIQAVHPLLIAVVVRKIPALPLEVLTAFTRDAKLFEALPAGIKSIIWRNDVQSFKAYVAKMVNEEYRNDPERRQMQLEMLHTEEELRRRLRHPVIKKIAEYIDGNIDLYNGTLVLLRSAFLREGDPAYGSLRFILLVVMAELNAQFITDDPVYELVRQLKKGIELGSFDDVVLPIKRFFDNVKKDNPIYGEVALVLFDSFISNALFRQVVKLLKEAAERGDENSKEDRDLLKWVSLLIQLGLSSLKIIETRTYRPPKLDKPVMNLLYPSLIDFYASSISSHILDPNLKRFEATDSDITVWEYVCSTGPGTIQVKVMQHVMLDCVVSGNWSGLKQLIAPWSHIDVYYLFKEDEGFWMSFMNAFNRWIEVDHISVTGPILEFVYQTILPPFTIESTSASSSQLQIHYFNSIHHSLASILAGASDSELLARSDGKKDLLGLLAGILEKAVEKLEEIDNTVEQKVAQEIEIEGGEEGARWREWINRANERVMKRKEVCWKIVNFAPNVFNLGRMNRLREFLEK